MKDLNDESIDLVVTSPPYFSLRDYSTWDTYEDYLSFISRVGKECYRVMKPGSWICWNVQDSLPFPPSQTGKERYSKPLAADSIKTLEKCGFNYERGIVWYKGEGTATQRLFGTYPWPGLLLISSLTEPIILMRKSRGKYKKKIDQENKEKSKLSKENWSKWTLDHWDIRPESAKRIGHPAPYPIEIPYRLIRMFSFVGDVVLDPFMGSGTTALAAKRCSRKYVGYDIHENYIELASKRITSDVDMFVDM